MPYVNQRWLGGMLTNFKTIRQSIKRLARSPNWPIRARWTSAARRKHAAAARDGQAERSLGGIKHMEALPDVLFVIDVGHENIAIHEAKKLGIPVVAVVDTNCRPDGIDYVIPGNDDAMRAIQLYAAGIADSVLEGKSSVPQVAVGEDEFVELDEAGNPRRRSPPSRAGQAGRRGARKPPARHRPPVLPAAAAAGATDEASIDADLDDAQPGAASAGTAPVTAPITAKRRAPAAPARRPRGCALAAARAARAIDRASGA